MRLIATAAALTGLLLASPALAAPDRVRIDSGTLVGDNTGGLRTFKGVPFAKPPVGELRWAPPQRISWSGERQATSFALPCPQVTNADGKTPNGGGVSGPTSEDCLYLNVFAPANARNAPVMLWLYGGAGTLGGGHLGSYQGDSFAKNGVITVTINYRLGALGNFVHPSLVKARKGNEPIGNYALMDAVAALEWVQRNIAAFGGDKNNVTLFGQSAGGIMVSSLLSAPAAKGLFHKAIIHSGTSLDAATTLEAAQTAGATSATAWGLPGADASLEQLRALPVSTLLRGGGGAMRSVVDNTFKTVPTRAAITAGQVKIPVIAGSNNGEGGVESADVIVDLLTAAGVPAWQYQFTYVPEWRTAEQPRGAPHSAEIPYAWNAMSTSTTAGGARVTDRDRAVAARMHACWVGFAKMPVTSRTITCADGFKWEARTPQNDAIAIFGETPSLAQATPLVTAARAQAAEQAAARAAAAGRAGATTTPAATGTNAR